jgi:hypothetical protein
VQKREQAGFKMHFKIQNLDESTSGMLPATCRDCGWWQGYDDGWPSEKAGALWEESAGEQLGYWGKLALGDDELLGFIQFGPAALFARAADIGGRDTSDSFLLACGDVTKPDISSLRKSLLVSALSEFKQLEIEHIDAFCSSREDTEDNCRIFSRSFLSDCGFYPVKSAGDLVMMRLELGGMQPVQPFKEKTRVGLLERIKRRSATPSPAAMCRKQ